MTGPLLILNSGSSSLKAGGYHSEGLQLLFSVHVDRLNHPPCTITVKKSASSETSSNDSYQKNLASSGEAVEEVASLFEKEHWPAPSHIGHRIVHGGPSFTLPVEATEDVLAALEKLRLAPLHNPPGLAAVRRARERWPKATHILVFDTEFHHHIPSHARMYGLPRELSEKHGIRRYGFHGISHESAALRGAELLQRPFSELRIISLHLGSGSSAAAIRHGRCLDTSMGLTPLEGLLMGTRAGDLDPGILFYLMEECGISWERLKQILNTESGLKGVGGFSDFRDLDREARAGNEHARLALEMYGYRIRKYIGAYLAVLGGCDLLVFTGGIGQHSAWVRQQSLAGLTGIGFQLDPSKNEMPSTDPRQISSNQSPIPIWVIPTNEERHIAEKVLQFTPSRKHPSL